MKQLNGTITLAYLEEDNQQRVIFRVVPLCTRDGMVFQTRETEFPDLGSLRVVPDKREQSTFKERMRTMGCFCAIQLVSDGKELTKVRQNRNYNPDQGESNQYAIYSDVISEFGPDGLFEVVESAESPVRTARALLLRNKVLYGPFSVGEPTEELKPFGNDRFLLHTVVLPDGSRHTFYWDPESTVNWRQRRGSLRRKTGKGSGEDAPESQEAVKASTEKAPPVKEKQPAKAVDKPAEKQPDIKTEKTAARVADAEPKAELSKPIVKAERSAEKPYEAPPAMEKPAELSAPVPASAGEREAALPIGTKLEILDSSISFEEQLDQIGQPLSSEANRLSAEREEEPERGVTANFNGTPLTAGAKEPHRAKRVVEPLRHVVEQQLRDRREDRETSTQYIENPMESLQAAMDLVWQSEATRTQAVEMLLEDEAFMRTFLREVQRSGHELHAVAAARAQMQDIEAERLNLLMQLDEAQKEQKKAEEKLLASMTQKKRDTLEQLDREIAVKQTEAMRLSKELREMGDQTGRQAVEWLAQNATEFVAVGEEHAVLSPVVGEEHTLAEMTQAVRAALNQAGFPYAEDETIELLLHFALSDAICLQGESAEDAERFAWSMLNALGLGGVTVTAPANGTVAELSLLQENSLRTPTVVLCRSGMNVWKRETRKTILLESADCAELPLCPVVRLPGLELRVRESKPAAPLSPTALSSFERLRASARPLPAEGERWFELLESSLADTALAVPKAVLQDMRVYVALGSACVRGGLIATADAANLHWLVPQWKRLDVDRELIRAAVASLPRTLEALEIR